MTSDEAPASIHKRARSLFSILGPSRDGSSFIEHPFTSAAWFLLLAVGSVSQEPNTNLLPLLLCQEWFTVSGFCRQLCSETELTLQLGRLAAVKGKN